MFIKLLNYRTVINTEWFLLVAFMNVKKNCIGIEIKQDNDGIMYPNLTTNYNIFRIKQSKHGAIKFYKNDNC